jgi:hypothetical protein
VGESVLSSSFHGHADASYDRATAGVTPDETRCATARVCLDVAQQLRSIHVRQRAHPVQAPLNRLQNIDFIVDEYNTNHSPSTSQENFYATPCSASAMSASMGSRMKKVVPTPHSVSKRSVPLCFLTMTLCAMARP